MYDFGKKLRKLDSHRPGAAETAPPTGRRRLNAALVFVLILTTAPGDISVFAQGRRKPERKPARNEQPDPENAPKSDREKNVRRKDAPKEDPGVLHSLDVRVTLGDGRIVRGKMHFRAPEKFAVQHTRQGVAYTKVIGVQDLRAIEFRKWKSNFRRRNKEGEIFWFEVAETRIELKSGGALVKPGSFPFLKRVLMENANGRAYFYSFWIDLLRPDGRWYTGMPALQGQTRAECFKDVIKRIEFTSAESEPDPESDDSK